MNIVTSKKAKAMQNHPIIKKHNESKLDTLFINPVYTIGIESKNDEESFSLLTSLYEHILQDKYIYRHKWSEDTLLMWDCLLYTSPSPRDATLSRMPSSA